MADLSSLRTMNRLYYVLLAAGGLVALAGLYAVHMMESHGHIISGMNNQIVWGLPHVFAIFLIVAASGVLNVASIGSVFGKSIYKARAPLASLLSIAMLSGGLTVLMLDLGRPDRIMVAATNYNLTSVFAWNVVLYSGMFSLVVIYLWTMMERRMNPFNKAAGLAVFVWRFRSHHRYRIDLRFPYRTSGLWLCAAAADVYRAVVCMGTGGVSCGAEGHLFLE